LALKGSDKSHRDPGNKSPFHSKSPASSGLEWRYSKAGAFGIAGATFSGVQR
jgi:hypothetical protein